MSSGKFIRIRSLAALAAVAVLATGSAGIVTAAPPGVPAIPLNAGQETPKPNSGANGFFSYTVDGTWFCYTLEAQNLSTPAVAAHIHLAPRNVAGPVVIPLTVGSGTTWSVSDCTTATASLLESVADSPGDYYVNVHTTAHPSGEIRGQLK
ncbi:CHRD domain-containing protein [Arthrobacter sp. ISL-48]|uniref:CHRD domain-containing protein n=1 Tax=Arthrobacter sp. ISL-48 TaxID=2819110 RepID=UPI001BE5794F|nr:CHRD domain-containing protein [Arthrobacter sp. ISL-48]MBT2530926.1 CHRD domain-containing protein [Arthrobacter sp. ISL-48]